MSGSGASFDNGPTATNSSCSTLIFDTQLTSPKADIVSQLSIDGILSVELHQANQNTVVCAKWRGQIAGGVASEYLRKLRSCLEQGQKYNAKVTSIQAGQVRVRVYPV